jgi:hypothetical protein
MATLSRPKKDTPASLNLFRISDASQEALLQYLRACKHLGYNSWDLRNNMRKTDLDYARENDFTDAQLKAKLANSLGDSTKFQNIVVPVVLPQVEAAVTYQASVFLSGVPIFGVVSAPQYIDQAKQLETIIDTQAIRGGWAGQLIMGFRDSFKYNFSPIELDWCLETIPSIQTDLTAQNSNSYKVDKVSWEGNVLKRKDPYNTFWDVRYPVSEVSQKGEFIGYSELASRLEIKRYLASTPGVISSNIKACLEAPSPSVTISADTSGLGFYIPQISQSHIVTAATTQNFDWFKWAGLDSLGHKIQYKNVYEKTVLYCRILPGEFGLEVPAKYTTQPWKLVFINQVLIYAQPLTFAHDTLPILFLCPNNDGLALQTKSYAKNGEPFQSVTSALMNSVIASRRRAISDRVLYDPSRIAPAQINSDNPSAKIPIRPAAYGKPLSESVYQFPYRDDQSQIALGNTLQGQNQAKQGQFVKGNKTLHEYQSVMNNANGRDQMISLGFEGQFFTPLKELIKLNILQYQKGGDLYSRELKSTVIVDPIALRKASTHFKLSDGLLPSDKIISGDAWQTSIQAISTSPQIGAAYNLGPMFSYLMKTQGADIAEFEKPAEQIAYEQAVQQWQLAIQSITEQAIKAQADLTKLQYPPQPLPQQFNYTPGMLNSKSMAQNSGKSILSQTQDSTQKLTQASSTPTATPTSPQVESGE